MHITGMAAAFLALHIRVIVESGAGLAVRGA
jgi:hypothetical protein